MGTNEHPLQKAVPHAWEPALDGWSTLMKAKGLLETTVDTRLRHVRQLARAASHDAPSSVTTDSLLTWCADRQWEPETRHAYYQSFRSFFSWFSATTGNDNPAASLPSVRRNAAVPRPIGEDALMRAINDADSRTRIILCLAAVVGLRASEIACIHQSDLFHDLTGISLTVHGKGSKARVVPLPDWLGTSLLVLTSSEPSGYLFPGQIKGHLSPRWISKLAARVLEYPWTLHTLRHRFSSIAYAQTGDILALRDILGHASIATTQIYTRTPDDARRKSVLAADITPPNLDLPRIATFARKAGKPSPARKASKCVASL